MLKKSSNSREHIIYFLLKVLINDNPVLFSSEDKRTIFW